MNLTKKQSLAILLSSLLFVTASSSIYLLTPYPEETTSNVSTIETLEHTGKNDNKKNEGLSIKTANNVVINNIKLLNKDSCLSATIQIPTSDIYLASEQLFKKINNPKIINPKIDILDNSFKLSLNYKLIGNFNTSFTCNLLPSVRDNVVYITISNVSVGKIHIPDNLVDYFVKKTLKDRDVNINYENSTLSYNITKDLPDLNLKSFNINKQEMLIELSYDFLNSIK